MLCDSAQVFAGGGVMVFLRPTGLSGWVMREVMVRSGSAWTASKKGMANLGVPRRVMFILEISFFGDVAFCDFFGFFDEEDAV